MAVATRRDIQHLQFVPRSAAAHPIARSARLHKQRSISGPRCPNSSERGDRRKYTLRPAGVIFRPKPFALVSNMIRSLKPGALPQRCASSISLPLVAHPMRFVASLAITQQSHDSKSGVASCQRRDRARYGFPCPSETSAHV